MMDLNIALKRQLGVLPNLYNAVFQYVLWVACDVTQGDFRNMLGNGAAKRLKASLQRFSGPPSCLMERFLCNWQAECLLIDLIKLDKGKKG